MGKTLDNIYKHQSLAYKYFLYLVSVALIVFFFSKGGKFKYEFQKGKPWQYENLYAPFDFSIKKTDEELLLEQQSIKSKKLDYYNYDEKAYDEVLEEYSNSFSRVFSSNRYTTEQRTQLFAIGEKILDSIYQNGFIDEEILSDEIFLL